MLQIDANPSIFYFGTKFMQEHRHRRAKLSGNLEQSDIIWQQNIVFRKAITIYFMVNTYRYISQHIPRYSFVRTILIYMM